MFFPPYVGCFPAKVSKIFKVGKNSKPMKKEFFGEKVLAL